jgi:hypothetical protein
LILTSLDRRRKQKGLGVARRGLGVHDIVKRGHLLPHLVKFEAREKGSDAAAIANQTIRVNVANANALKERRDAITRFVKVLARSIDWAYSDDRSIDTY